MRVFWVCVCVFDAQREMHMSIIIFFFNFTNILRGRNCPSYCHFSNFNFPLLQCLYPTHRGSISSAISWYNLPPPISYPHCASFLIAKFEASIIIQPSFLSFSFSLIRHTHPPILRIDQSICLSPSLFLLSIQLFC